MRNCFIVLGIVSLASFLFSTTGFAGDTATGAAPPPNGVPVAAVVQADHVFPLVVDGAEVVHDFILKNQGTAPLAVTRVKTG